MVLQEAPRVIEGAKAVDFNNRNGTSFTVEVVSGKAYVDNQDYLIELATRLDAGRLHSSRRLAREMMERNMRAGINIKDIEIPSIMLFRKKDTDPNAYIGFSSQRVFNIDTSEGVTPLLYVSTRVFDEEYRGLDLGRFAIQEATVVHDQATWLSHRTGTEVAAWSVLQAKVFKEGRAFPWDAPYHTDHQAQELMTGLFFRVRVSGREINGSTGVSIADYKEANNANTPRNHAPTARLHRIMTGRLGMVFERKDALYVVGELK